MSDPKTTPVTLSTVFHDMYLPFLVRYKVSMGGYFLTLSILYFLQPIWLPKKFNEFLDDATVRKKPAGRIRRDFMLLIGLVLVIAVIGYIKNAFDAFLPTRQFQFIRQQLYDRLITELQTRVHTIRVGEFITLMNYLPRETRYLSENIINMLPVTIGAFFLCIYTCTVSARAACVLILGILVDVWLFSYSPLAQRLMRESRERTEHIIANNSRITEEINQLDHIYTNNQEYEKIEENSEREDLLQSAFETSVHTSNHLIIIVFLWSMLVSIVALIIVYHEDPSKDRHHFRSYAFISSYFMIMMWNNMSRFTTFIMASESVLVFYRTFLQMMHHSDDTTIHDTTQNGLIIDDTTLEFRNVSFRYSPSSSWILHDLNWVVPPRTQWVLVGPSGRGKSTLLKLIMRFFPPTTGTIVLGDRPINSYNVTALRGIISFLHQDTMLFEKSIYENIVFGNEDLTRREVGDTLARFGLLQNFQRTPADSVDSVLDRTCGIDGRDLSKGQQKIVILARCLFRKTPRMYLMDEPLASLDRATQENVLRWIAETTQDKTVILTTHITDHSLFRHFSIRSLE